MSEINNDSNILVNLSHFLLKKIIDYVEDNIDIICFSLVCKRWFNERDKYLSFNTNQFYVTAINNTDIQQNHLHFNLPSYDSIYYKSIQSKRDCELNIDNVYYFTSTLSDFLFEYKEIREIKTIPNYITKITLGSNEFRSLDDYEYFYRVLSECDSVIVLNGCSTLKFGLPKSIETIAFNSHFNEELEKGSLPESLTDIDFGFGFNQPIGLGVLPDRLKKLSFDGHYKNMILQPGVLPSSLRVLDLSAYNEPLLSGSLPSNLKKLIYSGYRIALEENTLPQSLRVLVNVPEIWVQRVPLPNLEELTISNDFGELFPPATQYHLEKFSYALNTPIPSNIRIDRLEIDGSLLQPISSLPAELESFSLQVSTFGSSCRVNCPLPPSLKELNVSFDLMMLSPHEKPKSIETLHLGAQNLNRYLSRVPTSVKTLTFSNLTKIDSIPKNIKNVTNFIYQSQRFSYDRFTIRKLDDNYYLIIGTYQNNLIAKIVNQSKLVQYFNPLEDKLSLHRFISDAEF
ncbi:hypothetical protein PPL_08557 [Heterostelium album PN500]|uniref:F-box domain-containing protein n=1 Tax=Heterostelium pallidum (strain ATCC 26659 / Pp 5 / PN500) TaxID=670386 RepID=D3BJ36_HETP5|nr:hypothetical protein PPL_08557 [Heterostelium album PN500]EFA77916.1 hypothetical protein PPL_08557 [Heterostelium album PN500]|eukprot:XP_020430044.1 hypothetical protein PPL_08557 [Heterostelium album PN500]